MQPLLSPARKKFVLGVLVTLAVVGYIRLAWRQYSSYRHADQHSIQGLQSACSLQPENAEYWQALGAYQLTEFDTESALSSLKRSSILNPWNSRTWLMLATTYEVTGDVASQSAALDAAYKQDPKTPEVAWELGNFSLIRGEVPKALEMFRTVLENDPEQSSSAFRLVWQNTHDIDLILGNMVPDSTDAHVRLLVFLIGADEAAPAEKVWKRILQLGSPVSASESCKYVDYLIDKHEVPAAVHAWTDIADLNHTHTIQRDNLVVNGDFEEPISGCGFDWHYQPAFAAPVTIDSMEGKSGTHSLLIEFQGGAPSDVGLLQYIPVNPGDHYEFSAFVKSYDIQSSSGPRLGIFDAFTGNEYALTDDLLESNVWRDESLEFTAGPETRLVAIRVVRVPGDTAIKGKLWIDDVRLSKR